MIRRLTPLLAAMALIGCYDTSTGGGGDADGGRDRGVLIDAVPPDVIPDVTGGGCRLNSDCAPGLYCADEICTFDCRVDRDCPRGSTCQSGECWSDAPLDRGVERDRGVPILDAEVDARVITDARVARDARPLPDVRTPDARPPAPDMAPVEPRDLPLGSACERGPHCASNVCANLAVNGVAHAVCTMSCCSERDCPIGFGCQFFLGVKLCVPSRIYPPGYTFDRQAGQPCAGNACQSGLCDVGADRCLAACCTDNDCGGLACVWTPTGGGPRAICEPLPFGAGRTGNGCFGDLDCRSRVCVPYANAPGGAPGVCGDPCCTHQDCFGGNTCGRVATFENGQVTGVISACVPAPPGPSPDGTPCARAAECEGTECVDGICTRPCCVDAHCAADQRCLPRATPEGVFARVCAVPDE